MQYNINPKPVAPVAQLVERGAYTKVYLCHPALKKCNAKVAGSIPARSIPALLKKARQKLEFIVNFL